MRALLALLLVLSGCAEPAAPEGPAAQDQDQLGEPAPTISFQKDTTNARLRIVHADADADWNDIRARLDGCSARLHSDTVRSVPSDGPVTPASQRVAAGDYLQFSGSGTCRVSLIHVPSNSLFNEWTYSL